MPQASECVRSSSQNGCEFVVLRAQVGSWYASLPEVHASFLNFCRAYSDQKYTVIFFVAWWIASVRVFAIILYFCTNSVYLSVHRPRDRRIRCSVRFNLSASEDAH